MVASFSRVSLQESLLPNGDTMHLSINEEFPLGDMFEYDEAWFNVSKVFS